MSMKISAFTTMFLFITATSFAQWMTDGTLHSNPLATGGVVGIGIASPAARLHISDGGLRHGGTGEINIDAPNVIGGRLKIFDNGNTGIGTSIPATKLHIVSNTNSVGTNTLILAAPLVGGNVSHVHWGSTGDWYIRSAVNTGQVILQDAGGNVGIGTGAPRGKFDVDGPGDIYLSDDVNTGTSQSLFIPGHIYITPYSGSNVSYLQARRLDNSGTTALSIRTFNAGTMTDAMYIKGDGNIGIGTISPDAKLTVKGNIHAQGVDIDMSDAVGPDYVFEKDYDLLPLSELETYINQNKHLPEVPSAKEMEANGLDVREMNLLLLKKVEELTLHLIALKKEMEDLKTNQR